MRMRKVRCRRRKIGRLIVKEFELWELVKLGRRVVVRWWKLREFSVDGRVFKREFRVERWKKS